MISNPSAISSAYHSFASLSPKVSHSTRYCDLQFVAISYHFHSLDRLMATPFRPLLGHFQEDILQFPFLENSFTHFYSYPYKWNFRSPTLINISDLFPVLLLVNVLITVPLYHQKKSSNPCPRSDSVFPPFMFDSPVSFVILLLIRT